MWIKLNRMIIFSHIHVLRRVERLIFSLWYDGVCSLGCLLWCLLTAVTNFLVFLMVSSKEILIWRLMVHENGAFDLSLPSLFALNPRDFLLWSGGHEKLVSELLVFSFGTGRKAGRGRRVFSAAGGRRNFCFCSWQEEALDVLVVRTSSNTSSLRVIAGAKFVGKAGSFFLK